MKTGALMIKVHCRTGSLENHQVSVMILELVHCRIGSLEKAKPKWVV